MRSVGAGASRLHPRGAERRAKSIHEEPRFLAAWGPVREKVWLVRAGGEDRIFHERPTLGPHVTIWRFDEHEATLTFRTFHGAIGRGEIGGLWFADTFPPGAGWSRHSKAADESAIWVRPLLEGVAK